MISLKYTVDLYYLSINYTVGSLSVCIVSQELPYITTNDIQSNMTYNKNIIYMLNKREYIILLLICHTLEFRQ